MRSALPLLGLLASAPSFAGGIGILGVGGMYTERVYYYDQAGDQYRQIQVIGSAGAGIELALGDRDDKVLGIARGYWNIDTPEKQPDWRSNDNPPDSSVAPIANTRDKVRNVGVFMVGLQWTFAGNPEKFGVNALFLAGTGFITSDHTEYLQAELGAGFNYRITRSLDFHVDLTYQMRWRKYLRSGFNGVAGIRVLFD
jgi:hypothetical protein